MTAQEFNKEMGHYLKQRGAFRRNNPFLAARTYFKGMMPKQKKEELPLDISPEQVQQVIRQSAVAQRPVARPTARPIAKPLTRAAKPATKKQQKVGIMKWFNKKEDEEEYDVVETAAPVLDEDVKEVLKITFKWLKQMDPDLIDEIKASEDFEKYKKLLDKYGLIKK